MCLQCLLGLLLLSCFLAFALALALLLFALAVASGRTHHAPRFTHTAALLLLSSTRFNSLHLNSASAIVPTLVLGRARPCCAAPRYASLPCVVAAPPRLALYVARRRSARRRRGSRNAT